MENKVLTGEVVWFNAAKGFGFISRDDKKTDIFVHYSDINQPGFKVLMGGDKVSFEEDYNYKDRLKAINVMLLERNG
jgi:CspA family cold shock protein